jgi:hypothetical protein
MRDRAYAITTRLVAENGLYEPQSTTGGAPASVLQTMAFTASTSFPAPADVLIVEMSGGSGSGAGGQTGTNTGNQNPATGGGGGGGAMRVIATLQTVKGRILDLTIGTGGGVTPPATPGQAGAATLLVDTVSGNSVGAPGASGGDVGLDPTDVDSTGWGGMATTAHGGQPNYGPSASGGNGGGSFLLQAFTISNPAFASATAGADNLCTASGAPLSAGGPGGANGNTVGGVPGGFGGGGGGGGGGNAPFSNVGGAGGRGGDGSSTGDGADGGNGQGGTGGGPNGAAGGGGGGAGGNAPPGFTGGTGGLGGPGTAGFCNVSWVG